MCNIRRLKKVILMLSMVEWLLVISNNIVYVYCNRTQYCHNYDNEDYISCVFKWTYIYSILYYVQLHVVHKY